jgi:hypothetical protein
MEQHERAPHLDCRVTVLSIGQQTLSGLSGLSPLGQSPYD